MRKSDFEAKVVAAGCRISADRGDHARPYGGSNVKRRSGQERQENVVLVHGGFVDGSGWEGVYKILRKDGFTVTIVQNPTASLQDDVAVTKRALAAQNHPGSSRRAPHRWRRDHGGRQQSARPDRSRRQQAPPRIA